MCLYHSWLFLSEMYSISVPHHISHHCVHSYHLSKYWPDRKLTCNLLCVNSEICHNLPTFKCFETSMSWCIPHKHIWIRFKKNRMFKLLIPIQWKWMVTLNAISKIKPTVSCRTSLLLKLNNLLPPFTFIVWKQKQHTYSANLFCCVRQKK